ncbi:MAG: CHC2 zinc finger domain-containing protein, partial [Microcoleaceae cyanobacterium]
MKPQNATDWDNLKEKIKESIGIDRIVEGNGIKLKKVGKNLEALCPFHKETTPSFKLSSYKSSVFNQFRCFGCGVSGDIFDFYKAINSCNFPTALRDLAGIANLPLPEVHPVGYPKPLAERNQDYSDIPYSESPINQPAAPKQA